MSTHADRGHARLSPSGAYRWINCPGSVRMAEAYREAHGTPPRPDPDPAAEGTLAHELAEWYLREAFYPGQDPAGQTRELARVEAHPLFAPEMHEHVGAYALLAEELAAGYGDLAPVIEARVSYSRYVRAGAGTVDFLTVGVDELTVLDLKYGRNPVSAVANPQLALYGLGALARGHGVKRVRMVIFQPRVHGGHTEHVVTADQLREWGRTVVKPAALHTHSPTAPLRAGDHCRWCAAKPTCPAWADKLFDVAEAEPPTAIAPERVAELWALRKNVEAYFKSLDAHVARELAAGRSVGDLRLVPSRTRSKWAHDDATTVAELAKRVGDVDLVTRTQPITVTQARKLLGAEALDGLVGKTEAKPAVAPADDPRPGWAADMFDLD